jgi:hypothetical protein
MAAGAGALGRPRPAIPQSFRGVGRGNARTRQRRRDKGLEGRRLRRGARGARRALALLIDRSAVEKALAGD